MSIWDGLDVVDVGTSHDLSLASLDALKRQDGSMKILLSADLGQALVGPYRPVETGVFEIYLGKVAGVAWFAQRARTHGDVHRNGTPIRLLAGDPVTYRLALRAKALLEWHDAHRFCSRCGAKVSASPSGATTQCQDCSTTEFPRMDPAVIVAVTDPDDRLLLAHQASWEPGRVSLLAGFVEAGESAEQACFREVKEEASVTLNTVAAWGSQPWPFPRSIMLGFQATTLDTCVRVDGVELEWGDFYARDDLAHQVRTAALTLPSEGTIAARLIDAWFARRNGGDCD